MIRRSLLRQKGFTLLEIILAIAAMVVLASIVLVAVNPPRQLAEARNGTRRADVATIWNSVEQYRLNNSGQFPVSIPTGTQDDCTSDPASATFTICKTDSCAVTLSELLQNTEYLLSIPSDPSVSTEDYSGYNIVRDTDHNGRVTVCAPGAELDEIIYIPR